ncbi:MAG: TRAP transporter large permease [Desulfarculus sp.]|nr:TRAP transporter large permease [Desulfarculus sp.]
MEPLLMLGILLALLVLRLPIYLGLFLTGVLGLVIYTDLDLIFVAQTMVKKLDNFSLLCIPFFLLMGSVMVGGKSAGLLVNFARRLVCFMPGGLAVTSVISSAMFGAISGSAISTVVTIGGVVFPFMEQQKYPRGFTVGLVTSAAILGMIIPPSIIMIICALTAGESVVKLFAAGYLPGVAIMLALCAYAAVTAVRGGFGQAEKERFSWSVAGRAGLEAAVPIFLILLLFGGIYTGAFTITEASVVACFFSILAEVFWFRSMSPRQLWGMIVDSGILSGALVITVSGAGVLAEFITIRGIPEQILNAVLSYIPNVVVFFLFVNILLLIIGTFMDPIASVMILVPILMPMVKQLGVDPIHFLLVVTVGLGIGYITPPLGLLLYAAAAITKESFIFVVRAITPTLLIYIVMLFVLSYVPIISTLIPDLLFPN